MSAELCPNCSQPLEDDVLICLQCGYNLRTGEVLSLVTCACSAKDDPAAPEADRRITRRLALLALTVWPLILVWLWLSGRYMNYIHSKFWILLVAGAVFSGVMLLAVLVRGGGGGVSREGAWIRSGLILLPIFYLIGGYGESAGAVALDRSRVDALQRAVQKARAERQAAARHKQEEREPPKLEVRLEHELAEGEQPEELGEVDLLDLYELGQQKRIARVTFLARVDERRIGNRKVHVLFRFVIYCCAADMRPYAVQARGEPIEKFKVDDWVRVTGVLHTAEWHYGDRMIGRRLLIEVESAEPAKAPEQPYLEDRG